MENKITFGAFAGILEKQLKKYADWSVEAIGLSSEHYWMVYLSRGNEKRHITVPMFAG